MSYSYYCTNCGNRVVAYFGLPRECRCKCGGWLRNYINQFLEKSEKESGTMAEKKWDDAVIAKINSRLDGIVECADGLNRNIRRINEKHGQDVHEQNKKIAELQETLRNVLDRLERVVSHNDRLESVIERIAELRRDALASKEQHDIECPICKNVITVELDNGSTNILESRIVPSGTGEVSVGRPPGGS